MLTVCNKLKKVKIHEGEIETKEKNKTYNKNINKNGTLYENSLDKFSVHCRP